VLWLWHSILHLTSGPFLRQASLEEVEPKAAAAVLESGAMQEKLRDLSQNIPMRITGLKSGS